MDVLVVGLEVGGERYGIPAALVVEVVPAVPLRVVPGTHEGVVGLLRHRGQVVPVVDLSRAWGGGPTPRRMSTRIVLCDVPADGDRPAGRVGVLAERVTGAIRLDPTTADAGPGPATPTARGLGRLVHDADGLLQWVRPVDLLPADVLASLLRAAAEVAPW